MAPWIALIFLAWGFVLDVVQVPLLALAENAIVHGAASQPVDFLGALSTLNGLSGAIRGAVSLATLGFTAVGFAYFAYSQPDWKGPVGRLRGWLEEEPEPEGTGELDEDGPPESRA